MFFEIIKEQKSLAKRKRERKSNKMHSKFRSSGKRLKGTAETRNDEGSKYKFSASKVHKYLKRKKEKNS